MEERNDDKEKAEITLQARFNEKDKRVKGKWPMKSNGNFQNFGGRESQSSKNSTCQRSERSCNKNGGQGNFRGERKRIDKSKMQYFNCQRFDHFSKERNANKTESQGDEAKVARQYFDKENTLLFMITERGCTSSSNFKNVAEICYNQLQAE